MEFIGSDFKLKLIRDEKSGDWTISVKHNNGNVYNSEPIPMFFEIVRKKITVKFLSEHMHKSNTIAFNQDTQELELCCDLYETDKHTVQLFSEEANLSRLTYRRAKQ